MPDVSVVACTREEGCDQACFSVIHGLLYGIAHDTADDPDFWWVECVVGFPGSAYRWMEARYYLPGLADLPHLTSSLLWGIGYSYLFTWVFRNWWGSIGRHDGDGTPEAKE